MVNVIIVNYNCWEETIACVESVLTSTYKNFRVFIVDNHSSDESINLILKKMDKVVEFVPSSRIKNNQIQGSISSKSKVFFIQNPINKGFSAGNNLMIKYLTKQSEKSFIWLLNPDTVAENRVMEDLVELSSNREKIVAGNLILDYENREKVVFIGGFKVKKWTHGIKRIVQKSDLHTLDTITGASFFTKVSTFQELGLLPEKYFMYWEETDFCRKAKKNGYGFQVNSKSKIFDHVGSVANSNFLREYLYLLNGLRYYKKYFPWHLPLILISTFAKQIKAILLEDRVKINALYFAHIDFFRLLLKREIDVLKRINSQKK